MSRTGRVTVPPPPGFARFNSERDAVAKAVESGGLTSDKIADIRKTTVEQLGASSGRRSDKKCAYQGVPGAYSEVAALSACPTHEALPCEQFEVAFQALSQWLSDRAVLPVENSLGGSIHAVYDLMLRYRLHMVGEISLKINHCLVVLPGTKKEDITTVMSHPQALAQCDGYIRAMNVAREAVDDTAGAAQMISRKQMVGCAAICSSRGAELYGMEILDQGIQDDKDNLTRFVILSRDPYITEVNDSRPHKTSVVFSLGDGPGQLFRALAVFALRDIDMLKIESRPLRDSPLLTEATGGQRFNYLFYVDLVGKLCDVKMQNALRHLEEIAPFMRVLGSFPSDQGHTNVDSVLQGWDKGPNTV